MNLRALFCELRSVEDTVERARLIDERLAGDETSRQRLLELFAAAQMPAINPLDRMGQALGATVGFPESGETDWHAVDSEPDRYLPPYRLIEQIGEGGMGVVFMAWQQQPIRRMVAVKLIKPGMDSKPIIARFEAERQALATMNHPHIAKVLDAGTSPSGRPYFVMELVRGIPITEYCDRHNLGLQERLEVFANVCDAVHHAHQKGIIHRDLKPSNILVELDDVRPVPKVIDFGVAKSLHQPLGDSTIVTGLSQMIGTPLYMSPEQAQLNCFDVDVRSDVYSLGVVLYELLTGRLPFERETLKKVGLDEFRRVIREDAPPRPSTCKSTLNNKRSSTILETRQTDSRHLSVVMKRELDWIVLKSLEKDRNRRYQSAQEFADDVRHFLKEERVLACPPTWRYRLGKWTKRHKMLLASASFALVSLVGATGVSVWYSIAATQSLAVANDAERLASKRLEQVLAAQNEAKHQASLVERAANVIISRDINQVEELLRQLLLEQEERLGANDSTVIATINRLGVIYDEQGRLGEGEVQYRTAIDRCRVSDSVSPDTLLEIMKNLGGNLSEQARYPEAEAVWREVAERYRDLYGSQHGKTINAGIYLGIALSNQFKYKEAIAKFNALLDKVPEESEDAQALRWSIARCQEKLHAPLDRLLFERGVGGCRDNRWSQAFADFAEAMRADPNNPLYWYTMAFAAVRGGDTSSLRQHGQALLQNDGHFEDPEQAYWTVASLVLSPQSIDEWDVLLAKASPVLSASGIKPDRQWALGAAMCRAQKFQEASDHLRSVVEQESTGIGRLWLASALWNLGDRQSAREELAKAERQLAIFQVDAPWYLREANIFLVEEFRPQMGVDILPNSERREQ